MTHGLIRHSQFDLANKHASRSDIVNNLSKRAERLKCKDDRNPFFFYNIPVVTLETR